MCGPTRARLVQLEDAKGMISSGFPVLELPKRVAVNSLARQRSSHAEVPCQPGSPSDSRSSTPRSHGHTLRSSEDCSRQQVLVQQQQEVTSPPVSPRSACSTPGGADNSMGIQLHALVFSKQRHQHAQRRSMDSCGSGFGGSSRQQQLLAAGTARQHVLPHRNRTSHDLRRPFQDSSNPWGGCSSRGGGSMLKSISELGLTSSPTRGSSTMYRGSISKAKQVLAEAINSMPGTHGISDYSPATCDTDVPVLLSALRLLSKAAGSIDPELPAAPLSPSPAGDHNSEQQQPQQRVAAGWHKVLFALMPLLIPTHRRQGHVVLGAALELLVVLTEQHPQLHAAVCISGCLPPLLAQVLEGTGEQSLQAACILTGIVDTAAAQERLCQEPALAALLRVLSDSAKSVDVRLAAVHMLRRLASAVPRCVAVLKAQHAVPAVVALLRAVHDSDVRHAAAGLLHLLGTPVVVAEWCLLPESLHVSNSFSPACMCVASLRADSFCTGCVAAVRFGSAGHRDDGMGSTSPSCSLQDSSARCFPLQPGSVVFLGTVRMGGSCRGAVADGQGLPWLIY
ncbi:hypothetical protein COO60DRAFT_1624902 [Scenedesmus sp. NREL 46B-D3]|nr:hypothetical protein COO60DRAFT_1624902 [Scenedesmus sp. NREL 46B-D3]